MVVRVTAFGLEGSVAAFLIPIELGPPLFAALDFLLEGSLSFALGSALDIFLSFPFDGRSVSLLSSFSFPFVTGVPASPSRLLLHTPPSSNHSSFHISADFFTLSRQASPASQAALRCGAETAIRTLSSPMSTRPKRCVMAMAVSL